MSGPVIWHLSSNRWNSAITEYALSCAKSLNTLAYRNVFSPLTNSPAAKRAKLEGLETRPLESVSWLDYTAAKAILLDLKPDCIFVYGGIEAALLSLLPTKGIKTVRVRGHAIEAGTMFRHRHWLAHRKIQHLITPSERLARELTEKTGRVVKPVILGCDTKKYHRVAKFDPAARPEIVVLGRLDPVKGHAVIFELQRLILNAWPEGRPRPLLHIIGQPANLNAGHIRALANARDLAVERDWLLTEDRVHSIAEVLSRAAVGAVPSVSSEIICRTAEEFLLCGTPIAVSGVGSLNEVLFPGAGLSYYGVERVQAALLLRDLVLSSLLEGESAKVDRARRAAEVFSLAAMAERLQTALQI